MVIARSKRLRDEIIDDRLRNRQIGDREIIITGNGDLLCYDTLTDRFFMSTREKIGKAENTINAQCNHGMYASMNEFYALVGLPSTEYGEEFGWTSDHLMDIQFSSHLSSDDRPALAIRYQKNPVRGYYKING